MSYAIGIHLVFSAAGSQWKTRLCFNNLLPLDSEALKMNWFHLPNTYRIQHIPKAKIHLQISFTPGHYLVSWRDKELITKSTGVLMKSRKVAAVFFVITYIQPAHALRDMP